MRSLLFGPVLLQLPLLARAQMGWGRGAVYLPDDIFQDATSNKPNATGSFPITGFDVTKPYPFESSEADPIKGWSIELGVAAALSTANSTDKMVLPDDGYVGALSLRVKPPAKLVTEAAKGVQADNSWRVCITLMSNDGFSKKTQDAGKKDDGSCNTTFGSRCVAALQSAWARESLLNLRGDGGCHMPQIPSECREAFAGGGYGGATTEITFSEPYFGDADLIQIGSDYFKDKDNTTAYDLLGGVAHPVIIGWGFNQAAAENLTTVSYAGVSVACVRATKAAPGSTLPFEAVKGPDEDQDNGGKNDGNDNGGDKKDDDKKGAAGKVSGLGRVGTMFWGLAVALLVALNY